MAKIKKAITATLTVGLTLMMMAGCRERKAETVNLGPEETVEAFCRAVAGGEFEKAKTLCDTVAMNGYIERYSEALTMQARKDSGAVAIATAELAKSEFAIDDVVRNGESRQVHYTIATGDGMNKKKTATVKRTEGVWKVEEITDRI